MTSQMYSSWKAVAGNGSSAPATSSPKHGRSKSERDLGPSLLSPSDPALKVAASTAAYEHSFKQRANLAVSALLGRRRRSTNACVMLPSYGGCQSSLGNTLRPVLNAVLLSLVLDVELAWDQPPAALTNCTQKGYPRFRLETVPMGSRAVIELAKLLNESGARDGKPITMPADRCVQSIRGTHGQDVWSVLELFVSRHLLGDETTRRFFRLGASFGYGTLLRWAFDLGANAHPLDDDRELRISVHTRHFGLLMDTSALASEAASVEVIEGRIEDVVRTHVSPSTLPRCAILLASDRRLTLHLFEAVAARRGCRLVTSTRASAWDVSDKQVEHGVDVGSVALRDVELLSRGHVLIGSWGSSFSLIIQEMIASRGAASESTVAPTVTYCSNAKCMLPFPLHPSSADSAWQVTLVDFPRVRLDTYSTFHDANYVCASTHSARNDRRQSSGPGPVGIGGVSDVRRNPGTQRLRKVARNVHGCSAG